MLNVKSVTLYMWVIHVKGEDVYHVMSTATVCVVVWKVKQAADIRRPRRLHVVEFLHLDKWPFAHVFLVLNTFDIDSSNLQVMNNLGAAGALEYQSGYSRAVACYVQTRPFDKMYDKNKF